MTHKLKTMARTGLTLLLLGACADKTATDNTSYEEPSYSIAARVAKPDSTAGLWINYTNQDYATILAKKYSDGSYVFYRDIENDGIYDAQGTATEHPFGGMIIRDEVTIANSTLTRESIVGDDHVLDRTRTKEQVDEDNKTAWRGGF